MKKISLLLLSLCVTASAFSATSVSLKLSGDGAVNDSTIAVGKKVSVDIYLENEGTFTGMTLGFRIFSDNIKKIIHASDSSNGLNSHGDVKGFNGWQDKSVWDMGGVYIAPTDWDGILPDLLGIGGVCLKKVYAPHKLEKKLSFDLIIEEAGTFVIDSGFFKPAGRWLMASPATAPQWNGPYTFNVKK